MNSESISQAIIRGDAPSTAAEVGLALEKGTNAGDILHKACIPAMVEVGRLFELSEIFVPEMLVAARAMQGALDILRPHLVEGDLNAAGKVVIGAAGKVVIGTVSGDLHDIGKNLVCIMFEGAGFEVIDLGTDVEPETFVKAVQEHQPDLLGMSALLTTTMPSMEKTILALKEAGLRDRVLVMIGGAPVTEDFAAAIGADGYAPDASSATRKAREFMGIA
jgi:5-methyltetrahydrofolate--homocysteine methyltransferase